MENDIYKMKLHNTITVAVAYQLDARITRVAGGWIYQYLQSKTVAIRQDAIEQIFSPVFVPFDNEFMLPKCDGK
jgi:hypothetical protein